MNTGVALYLAHTADAVRVLLWVLLWFHALCWIVAVRDVMNTVKGTKEYVEEVAAYVKLLRGIVLLVLLLCVVPTKAEVELMTGLEKPSTEAAGKP